MTNPVQPGLSSAVLPAQNALRHMTCISETLARVSLTDQRQFDWQRADRSSSEPCRSNGCCFAHRRLMIFSEWLKSAVLFGVSMMFSLKGNNQQNPRSHSPRLFVALGIAAAMGWVSDGVLMRVPTADASEGSGVLGVRESDEPLRQGRGRGRRFRGGRGAGTNQVAPADTSETAEIQATPAAEKPAENSDDSASDAASRFQQDRELFHALLGRHTEIRRTVENLEDGVRTVTEADDPELAAMIRTHVERMKTRVEEPAPIHLRDPLFAELFRHADKIEMKIEATENGVRVIERSDDPYVVKLIQAHAKVVESFVREGHAEVRRNHELPERK